MPQEWGSEEQEAGFRSLLARYGACGPRLARLFATNARFRGICEDYGAALCAAEALSARPEAAHQFHCISVELETEVAEILQAPPAEEGA